MQTKPMAAETIPEEVEDLREFLGREAELLLELKSGVICKADYKRLKEEAWEVYRARTGRLDIDDDAASGSSCEPAG